MNLASMPLAEAGDFCGWLAVAASEVSGRRPDWTGVAHLAAMGAYASARSTVLYVACMAARWSNGRVPEDVRAAYRALAAVLFRAARGLR